MYCYARAHLANERRIAADLGVEREGANASATTRHPQIEAADRLAVMTGHHAQLDVEIEIGMARLDLAIVRPGHRRFDEVAAVVNVAAHRHPQRAVGPTVDLHRRLIAVGGRVDRKVRRLQIAFAVELDGAARQ